MLIDTQFWSGLVDWIKEKLVAESMVAASDVDLFMVTDSVDEAVAHIVAAHANMG